MILAFSFGDMVLNHLARRFEYVSFPPRLAIEVGEAYDFALP